MAIAARPVGKISLATMAPRSIIEKLLNQRLPELTADNLLGARHSQSIIIANTPTKILSLIHVSLIIVNDDCSLDESIRYIHTTSILSVDNQIQATFYRTYFMKTLTLLTGVLALLLLALSGPLYQAEILGLKHAFLAMTIALGIGVLSLLLALIQVLFMRKSISWSTTIIAVVCASITVYMPLSMRSKASTVPPIHDITTDLVNPPKFVAILALRADAPNPAEYQGEKIASQQREAYPEITTQQYQQSSEQVFNASMAALKEMGLEVVNSDQSMGLIEAYDTTTWFGFIDDVVIRIQNDGEMTLLDARSKSRVGMSDIGKNAERLNDLFAGIKNNLN